MSLPEAIITGGSEGASPEARLQQVIEQVAAAIAALQDAVDLLTEKARQLHAHEAVMADRDRNGHFRPGAGFTYDPDTGVHNVDALSGVAELTTREVQRLLKERDVPAPSLHSPAGSRATAIAAGTDFTVPAYRVGFGELQVWLDGVLCVPGEDAAHCQYREIGAAGASSTIIRWHDEIAVSYDIFARVR